MGLPTPNTRKEQFLNAIATGNSGGLPTPITREEEYLDAIAKSGGGGGEGDMKKSVYDSDLDVANAGGIGAFVGDAVSGKVDKVEGKGLSENDYSDTEKGKVADNAEAIEAMVNVNGSCNALPLDIGYMKSANTTGTWNNNMYTLDGVTFTVNADNIVVNGTPSINIDFFICSLSHLKTGAKYTCSAGNNNVSIGTVHVNIPSGGPNTDPDAPKFDFTYNGNQPYVRIIVMANTQVNNEVFKPMLYDARLTPTGYVPYAMTNRELTERIQVVTKTITIVNGYAQGTCYFTPRGDKIPHVFIQVGPDYYISQNSASTCVIYIDNTHTTFRVYISDNGNYDVNLMLLFVFD